MYLTLLYLCDLYQFKVFSIQTYIKFLLKVGVILNTIALVISRKQSHMPQIKSRTNVHYLVFHLTVADSIICFITLPMETLWRLTIEWHAGNLACKVLMMFRTGGYILSSCILVVISIDRYGYGQHKTHNQLSIFLIYIVICGSRSSPGQLQKTQSQGLSLKIPETQYWSL